MGVLLSEADIGRSTVDGVDGTGHLRSTVLTVHTFDLEVVAVQHRAVQFFLFWLRDALAGATATAAALAMQIVRIPSARSRPITSAASLRTGSKMQSTAASTPSMAR